MSRARKSATTHSQGRSRRQQTNNIEEGWAFFTGQRRTAVLCALLATATFGLYAPVIGHSFVVWDDHEYVVANPHIIGGLTWSTMRWAFTSTYAANWHPLTWISHALDVQLFELNPAGHHFDSVLIHSVNAVLLLLLLNWITNRIAPSFLVAALFALHPLNVESVAWVAERKNLLSTLFLFLAIAAYAWYARRPDWRRYLLLAGLFAAGLMSKPMVITLPPLLLLLDYWPLHRMSAQTESSSSPVAGRLPQLTVSKLLAEKIPLFLLSAASGWITLRAQGGAVRALYQFPPTVRIENALVAYTLYLWKMFWPARLAAFYPHPANTLPMWRVIVSALILVAVTAAVLILHGKRYLLVGWLWFLGTLVPVLGLVQVGGAAMADRYAYSSLIGIFIMIAWGLDDWAEARKIRTAWRVIPALSVLTVLGFVTSWQITVWANEFTLWSHAVAITERNPFAHSALAVELLNPEVALAVQGEPDLDTEQKRLEQARRHYEEAVSLYGELMRTGEDAYLPDMAAALSDLGNVAQLQGRPSEARSYYEEAFAMYRQLAQHDVGPYRADMARALGNLANLDRQQSRVEEAREHYQEQLDAYRKLARQDPDRYSPDLAGTLNNLGNFEKQQDRLNEAREHYTEALELYRKLAQEAPALHRVDLAGVLNNLGRVNGMQNRLDEARQNFGEALTTYRQLDQQDPGKYLPDLAWTLYSLGFADQLQKRFDESRVYSTEALTIYQKLAQENPGKYTSDVVRVETSLHELESKAPSR
jgi:protein O-mannosyl-transferase